MLARRLIARVRVAPDHVAIVARVDRVVTAAAEQVVVHAVQPAHHTAFVVRVPLVVFLGRPAGVVGLGERGAGAGEQGAAEHREQAGEPACLT